MTGREPAGGQDQSTAALRLAAALITVGAACLAVKAIAIIVTGDQPPVLFEVAGLPLGLGLLLLARWSTARHGRARRLIAAASLSVIAVLASAIWGVTEILSQAIAEPLESPLAISGGLFPMIAALLIGLRLRAFTGTARRMGRRALLIAITFVPLMILGGIIGDVSSERYFEVGLLVTAVLWLLLAHAMLTEDDGMLAE